MLWLPSLILSLGAVWPATAQPNEAETLFRQMEKKVTSAKALECNLKGTIKCWDGSFPFESTLALTEGNKTHLELNINYRERVKYEMISDGLNLRLSMDSDGLKKNTPKLFSRTSQALFSRAGVVVPFYVFFMNTNKDDALDRDWKLDDLLVASDFKLGKEEIMADHKTQAIEHFLKAKNLNSKIEVVLYIDSKTCLPLKRVVTIMGVSKSTYTEIYSAVILEGSIDPKKFELPKD
jgi:hypothetical protein